MRNKKAGFTVGGIVCRAESQHDTQAEKGAGKYGKDKAQEEEAQLLMGDLRDRSKNDWK